MKRKFTTAVGAAAILALAAAGCKKDEKANPAGGASGAAGGGGEAAPAVPPQTGFAVFPATSKFLIGVNLASARSSALWAMFKPQIDQAMTTGDLGDIKTSCGFDPTATLQSFMVGGDPQTDDKVMVARGISRAQAKTCAEKIAASKNEKLTVTDEGNFTLFASDNEKLWTAWLDDTTVVATDKDKDFVAKRAAGDAGLADGSELMGLLKNADTAATLYFVATADAMGASSPVSAMMPGAKGFFGSIRTTDGIDIDAGVRFDTDENAKAFTGMAQQQIDSFKGQQLPGQMAEVGKLLEKAQVKQNGKDMVVQLKLTSQDLKGLEGLAKQAMGETLGGGQPGGSPR